MTSNPSIIRCKKCRVLSTTKAVWMCIQCRGSWCDGCWDEYPAHNPNLEEDDPFAFEVDQSVIGEHEKLSKEVFDRLSRVFATLSKDERKRAHETESQAKWFGVSRGEGNQLFFGDTNRLTSIINDSWTDEYPDQYPSIVSFVGETGAGKSTIIRAVLTRQQHLAGRDGEEFLYPIPGRPGDPDPTSGDVHLYPDPGTQWSLTPRLFADCEGLGAGDKTPVALSNVTTGVNRIRAFRRRAKRRIAWATGDHQMRRDEAVAKLFPQILYTTSDVVVFVLKAAKTLEKVVSDHLIPWAARSIYKSLNQAVPPHVIIVINGEDISIDKDQWDHHKSTETYLNSLQTPIANDRNLTSIVEKLERRVADGIKTHADLLKHFYSSVTFVNVPQKAYLMRMDKQLGIVYDVINERCSESYGRKFESRVLFKAERLERILAAVFDHFSQEPDKPFDFLMDSLWQSPIPGGLEDNILRFFRAFQRSVIDKSEDLRHNPPKFFRMMTEILSAHFFLDSERYNIPSIGFASLLSPKHYGPLLRKAFDTFCETSLHCAFESKHGTRCCNVKSSHSEKGHQGADGKLLGKGEFQFRPDFEPVTFFDQWEEEIRQALGKLSTELHRMIEQGVKTRHEVLVANIHQRYMRSFLSHINVAEFLDHHVCLCCLRHNMPEYSMPCGNVLCAACMKFFKSAPGREPHGCDDSSKNKTACPFHTEENSKCSLEGDEKPRGAGVRILCLDGGGVRGIIQLALLRAIQDQLGDDLKIQWFFDLVVGTSTGGIIALNLFVKNRPLNECIRDFKTLCTRAFSPRELRGIPILGKLAMMNHGSVFKTKPFESILQREDILGEQTLLFGGPGNSRPRWNARVAVTTTDQTSKQRPAIIANYNRPGDERDTREKSSYVFLRESTPRSEMKIWEAARATSAAFPYFKPFVKDEVKREFVDGGFYHNCPVKIAISEKRLLWSDVRMDDPDILLSLGTGKGSPTEDKSVFRPTIGRIGRRGIIGKAWELTAGLLENVFAGQNTWSEFLREATERHHKHEAREYTRRYIRLNVDIPGVVPKLFMSDKVDEMEALVRANGVPDAKEIAHRLVASCFYFRITSTCDEAIQEDYVEVKGTIECRFAGELERMKALGNFLDQFVKSSAAPSFLIETNFNPNPRGASQNSSQSQVPQGETREVSADVITNMRDNGIFSLLPAVITAKRASLFRISICLERKQLYSHNDAYLSISGFPRKLEAEGLKEESMANRKEFGLHSPIGSSEHAPPPTYEFALEEKQKEQASGVGNSSRWFLPVFFSQ